MYDTNRTEAFCSRLRSLRRSVGLTQRELAERLGISDKSYSKWETGESDIGLSSIFRLADELGIEASELFSDKIDIAEPHFELAAATELFSLLGDCRLFELISKLHSIGRDEELTADHAAMLLKAELNEVEGLFERSLRMKIFRCREVCLGGKRVGLYRLIYDERLFLLLRLVDARSLMQ